MNNYSDNTLEKQKNALLAMYSAEELQRYQRILEENCYLEDNLHTIIEIKTEVGTDGE